MKMQDECNTPQRFDVSVQSLVKGYRRVDGDTQPSLERLPGRPETCHLTFSNSKVCAKGDILRWCLHSVSLITIDKSIIILPTARSQNRQHSEAMPCCPNTCLSQTRITYMSQHHNHTSS
jgi:hypothetical protein